MYYALDIDHTFNCNFTEIVECSALYDYISIYVYLLILISELSLLEWVKLILKCIVKKSTFYEI